MKKAPHYIVAFSEGRGAYMANVGFMLQQMDLYFSATGLGSCWQGIPKPVKQVMEGSNSTKLARKLASVFFRQAR